MQLKISIGILLSLLTLNVYAIEVQVQSPEKVSVIGLLVNGKEYGGVGNRYTKADGPAGNYSFGIRANGVFSKDIGCTTKDGKWAFKLTKNTHVTLDYDGKKCTVVM